jgi:uncharacterized protein YbaR (Trm112 family)
MDQKLLALLACPLCQGKLIHHVKQHELICRIDRLAYPIREGIPVMLVDQARRMASEEVE